MRISSPPPAARATLTPGKRPARRFSSVLPPTSPVTDVSVASPLGAGLPAVAPRDAQAIVVASTASTIAARARWETWWFDTAPPGCRVAVPLRRDPDHPFAP